MLYSYEELIGLDDDIEDTASFLNTELDYYLCSQYGIVLDELDLIPMDKLRELRIYALFEAQDLLDEQTHDLELWIEEHKPIKDIIPFHNQTKGDNMELKNPTWDRNVQIHLQEYIDYINEIGKTIPKEKRNSFVAGAAALFTYLKIGNELPSSWVLGPLFNKDPFEKE